MSFSRQITPSFEALPIAAAVRIGLGSASLLQIDGGGAPRGNGYIVDFSHVENDKRATLAALLGKIVTGAGLTYENGQYAVCGYEIRVFDRPACSVRGYQRLPDQVTELLSYMVSADNKKARRPVQKRGHATGNRHIRIG